MKKIGIATQPVNRVRPSSQSVSERMSATRGHDNPLERKIRSLLHRRGFRIQKQRALLIGTNRTADIVLPKYRLVVFVDGCFWHGCPWHRTWPKSNAAFWRAKIEANKKRDKDTTRRLRVAGWRVIRIWEHVEPETAVERIVSKLTV